MDRSKIYRKAALDRLSSPDQFDQLMRVTGPRSWIVLAALLLGLVVLLAWGIFGRVITRTAVEGVLAAGADGNLVAHVRAAPEQAARIEPGMTAHIVPASLRPEEHGYLIGTVEHRVDERSPADSTVTFSIRLHRADGRGGGYASTSGSARERAALQPGAPIIGSIVLEERRPVAVALPAVAPLFSIRREPR